MFIKAEENKIYVTKDDEFAAGYLSGSFYSELQDTYVYKGIPLSAYWMDEAPDGVDFTITLKEDAAAPIVLQNEDYAAALGSPIEGDVYYVVSLTGTPTKKGVYTLQVEYMNGLELGQYEVQNIELHVVDEPQGETDNNGTITVDGGDGSSGSPLPCVYVSVGEDFRIYSTVYSHYVGNFDEDGNEKDENSVSGDGDYMQIVSAEPIAVWGVGGIGEDNFIEETPPDGVSVTFLSEDTDVSPAAEELGGKYLPNSTLQNYEFGISQEIDIGPKYYYLVIFGTPTTEGIYHLTVGHLEEHKAPNYISNTVELHVGSTPAIDTTTFPQAKKGQPYNASVSYTGTEPITWSITDGSLPPGLTLDADTGVVSGTIN